MDRITFHIKDSEPDAETQSFPVNFAGGGTLTNYQDWTTAFAPLLDAMTDGQILTADITLALTLPGGLKGSPVALSQNERGGRYSWLTSGGVYREAFRVPAILNALISGQNVGMGSPYPALAAYFSGAHNSLTPITPFGYNWISTVTGKKSRQK